MFEKLKRMSPPRSAIKVFKKKLTSPSPGTMTIPSLSLNFVPSCNCFSSGSNPYTFVANVFGKSLSEFWNPAKAASRG